jgi:hypothetical protein
MDSVAEAQVVGVEREDEMEAGHAGCAAVGWAAVFVAEDFVTVAVEQCGCVEHAERQGSPSSDAHFPHW